MNVREPRKKHYVKLKPQPPFPITIGEGKKWTMYTAHLTYLGACIVEPNEIHAVHSMGFFGKGSLSRSYPSFGKARYGAPPVIRNRQWVHRQEWLQQVKELSIEPDSGKNLNLRNAKHEEISAENDKSEDIQNGKDVEKESDDDAKGPQEQETEDMSDVVEVHPGSPLNQQVQQRDCSTADKTSIEDAVLDSSEEDDVCVILNSDAKGSSPQNTESLLESKSEEQFDSFNSDGTKEYNSWNDDTSLQNKLLVLPDSDCENEDYLKNIKPRVKSASYPIQETLHLTYEETFFLLYGLGCLNLINFDGTLLSIDNAWEYFCKTDKNFVQKYVIYHYFRSKGWVVKPGLKYGGDFLLYKQGPPFYHASYIVLIDVIDADTLISIPGKSTRNFTWNSLLGLERLSETAAKEILFAQVLWPSSVPLNSISSSPDVLSEFTVKELLWRRWNPKHNKNMIDVDDKDEDSC